MLLTDKCQDIKKIVHPFGSVKYHEVMARR